MPLGIPHSEFLSWDPDDQDKAIAYTRNKREICECGTRAADWVKDPDAYIAFTTRCPGCQRLEEERENVPEGEKGVHMSLVNRKFYEEHIQE